mmetsp:Transcript_75568/g.213792  ORF Transcript_75568/g.213792 Transcript_75568/m.213792 type:complete len:204 (+) Transcript_75568:2468-3079(+)
MQSDERRQLLGGKQPEHVPWHQHAAPSLLAGAPLCGHCVPGDRVACENSLAAQRHVEIVGVQRHLEVVEAGGAHVVVLVMHPLKCGRREAAAEGDHRCLGGMLQVQGRGQVKHLSSERHESRVGRSLDVAPQEHAPRARLLCQRGPDAPPSREPLVVVQHECGVEAQRASQRGLGQRGCEPRHEALQHGPRHGNGHREGGRGR